MYRYEYQATPQEPLYSTPSIPNGRTSAWPKLFLFIFPLVILTGLIALFVERGNNNLLTSMLSQSNTGRSSSGNNENVQGVAMMPQATPSLVSPRQPVPTIGPEATEKPIPTSQPTQQPTPSATPIPTVDPRPTATPIPTLTPTPTPAPVSVNAPTEAKGYAVFMRSGEIWKRDLVTQKEQKISVTQNLGYPVLSPDGNRAYYYDYPASSNAYGIYVTDISGHTQNKFSYLSSREQSRPKWSANSQYLGVMLYAKGTGNIGGLVPFIFDVNTNRAIQVGEIKVTNWNTGSYEVIGWCNETGNGYNGFCQEYVSHLNQGNAQSSTPMYKRDIMEGSDFKDTGYSLTRSENLNNGLIVAEYASGSNRYTLLVRDIYGQILAKIPQASQASFLLK